MVYMQEVNYPYTRIRPQAYTSTIKGTRPHTNTGTPPNTKYK